MLENVIYASSDIILIIGTVLLSLLHFLKNENPRLYFLLSKILIVVAMLLSLIFYNKTFAVTYLSENSYTTMIKIVVYVLSFSWLHVSYKWFVGKNLSGYLYCILVLLITEDLCLLISSMNIVTLIVCLFIFSLLKNIFVENYIKEGEGKKQKNFFEMILLIFVAAATIVVYKVSNGCGYEEIKSYILENKSNTPVYVSMTVIFISLLYFLGIFPFSFSNMKAAKKCILPVSGYVAIIPPIAFLSAIFMLIYACLNPIYDVIKPVLIILCLLSMYYGALAAKREKNIRSMFYYSSIYHFAVVLLIITYMAPYAVLSAFVYFIIYILALFGIFTAMYAFKSRGEYLTDIVEIGGIYQVLPYVASSVVVLVLSMLGTPPLLGFLGRFYVVNQLFSSQDYLIVLLVLLPLGFLVFAYLEIIKSMYFEKRIKIFDRVDKGIYIALLLTMAIILIALFNTYDIVNIARNIIYAVFKEA